MEHDRDVSESSSSRTESAVTGAPEDAPDMEIDWTEAPPPPTPPATEAQISDRLEKEKVEEALNKEDNSTAW